MKTLDLIKLVLWTVLAISTFSTVQCNQIQVKCPLYEDYYCACTSREPMKPARLRMCFYRIECKPCGSQYLPFLKCAKPLCAHPDLEYIQWYRNRKHSRYTSHPTEALLSFYSSRSKIKYGTPTLTSHMRPNTSHSPSSTPTYVSSNLKNVHENRSTPFKLVMVKELNKLVNYLSLGEGSQSYVKTNDMPRNLRQRHNVDDDDKNSGSLDAFRNTGDNVTKRQRQFHGHMSPKEDSVSTESIIKDSRKLKKPLAGRKRPLRLKKIGDRGKKHKEFSKNSDFMHNAERTGNRTHKNINWNSEEEIWITDMAKTSHFELEGSPLFDKQIKEDNASFDRAKGDSSYKESDKVNATYISKENSDFLSVSSENLSTTSTPPYALKQVTLPLVVGENQKTEKSAAGNVTSPSLPDKNLMQSGSSSKQFSTVNNPESNSFKNLQNFEVMHMYETSNSSDYVTDYDLSSRKTDYRARKDLFKEESNVKSTTKWENYVFERRNFSKIDETESPLPSSFTIQESSAYEIDQYSIEEETSEISKEENPIIVPDDDESTDDLTNMSSSDSGEQLEETNMPFTTEGDIFGSEMENSEMSNGTASDLLGAHIEQSTLDYVSDQHLSSENNSSIDANGIGEKQLDHTDVSPKEENDANESRNSRNLDDTESESPRSLVEQDPFHITVALHRFDDETPEYGIDTVSTDNPSHPPDQQDRISNSPTSAENENLELENTELEISKSHLEVTFAEIEGKPLVDDVAAEYTVEGNQIIRKNNDEVHNLTSLSSHSSEQQLGSSNVATLSDGKNFTTSEMNFENLNDSTSHFTISLAENESIKNLDGSETSETMVDEKRSAETSGNVATEESDNVTSESEEGNHTTVDEKESAETNGTVASETSDNVRSESEEGNQTTVAEKESAETNDTVASETSDNVRSESVKGNQTTVDEKESAETNDTVASETSDNVRSESEEGNQTTVHEKESAETNGTVASETSDNVSSETEEGNQTTVISDNNTVDDVTNLSSHFTEGVISSTLFKRTAVDDGRKVNSPMSKNIHTEELVLLSDRNSSNEASNTQFSLYHGTTRNAVEESQKVLKNYNHTEELIKILDGLINGNKGPTKGIQSIENNHNDKVHNFTDFESDFDAKQSNLTRFKLDATANPNKINLSTHADPKFVLLDFLINLIFGNRPNTSQWFENGTIESSFQVIQATAKKEKKYQNDNQVLSKNPSERIKNLTNMSSHFTTEPSYWRRYKRGAADDLKTINSTIHKASQTGQRYFLLNRNSPEIQGLSSEGQPKRTIVKHSSDGYRKKINLPKDSETEERDLLSSLNPPGIHRRSSEGQLKLTTLKYSSHGYHKKINLPKDSETEEQDLSFSRNSPGTERSSSEGHPKQTKGEHSLDGYRKKTNLLKESQTPQLGLFSGKNSTGDEKNQRLFYYGTTESQMVLKNLESHVKGYQTVEKNYNGRIRELTTVPSNFTEHLWRSNPIGSSSQASELHPESKSRILPKFKNAENPIIKKDDINDTPLNTTPEYRQEISTLQKITSIKEKSKGNSTQVTLKNATNSEDEFAVTDFSTGRKLLQFSKTSGNKLVITHLRIPRSAHRRFIDREYPHSEWCVIPYISCYGRMQCNIWTYQKICVIKCNEGHNIQGASQGIFKCTRKKNTWEPQMQTCVDGDAKKQAEGSAPKAPKMKGEQKQKISPVSNNLVSKKTEKPRTISTPIYDDYYEEGEYDDYEYESEVAGEERGKSAASGQKDGKKKSQPSPSHKGKKDLSVYDYEK